MKSAAMNLDGLTPEQREFILDLSKRIQMLESKLLKMQEKLVKIDPTLTAHLSSSLNHFNLN